MTSAVAGDLGNVESLQYKAIYKKATSGGSAIAPGAVVKLTEATGVGALAPAAAAVTGPFGVVPRLNPINVDADDTFQVVKAPAEVYVVADGVIKPNARVQCATGTAGRVIAFVIDSPVIDEEIVGVYLGKVDEGSGLVNEGSDAATGNTIRIRLTGASN
jgi:hypothetical protein